MTRHIRVVETVTGGLHGPDPTSLVALNTKQYCVDTSSPVITHLLTGPLQHARKEQDLEALPTAQLIQELH